jgi:hypothetical protein
MGIISVRPNFYSGITMHGTVFFQPDMAVKLKLQKEEMLKLPAKAGGFNPPKRRQ